MNMRHDNGIPFKVGDVLSEIEGLDGEVVYFATACASYPRGNDKIGHLTSMPTSSGGIKIRKFNGDVVWWMYPPEEPTSLMAAMNSIMGLLSGSAMQITTEVRCTVAGHRKHYWESHVIDDLEEIDGLLRDAAASALASFKAAK